MVLIMERTLAAECTAKIGQAVLVAGWVNTIRGHGKIVFIDLRDRSSLLQVVFTDPSLVEKTKEIKPEWVIEVEGIVKARPEKLWNKEIATGQIELTATAVKVLAKAEELPFDMGGPTLGVTLPTLLDYRSLSIRHPSVNPVFKVQQVIAESFRETLQSLDFTELFFPTLVPTATEGGAEVFHVDYFDKDAYLAQSPQFYKQIGVGAYERVFTLAHAYRAEPSVTTRHITEYVGLDAELGFINSYLDVIAVADTVIRNVFDAVGVECVDILKKLGATVPTVAKKTPIIKLTDALQVIYERTGRDERQEPDLSPQAERDITDYAKEKFGSEIIFVTHYPTKKRPFYTYPDPENPQETQSFDLIGRGVEWITGGRRINDYDQLLGNIKKWGNDPAKFDMYLQTFKYGMPPEGGFCIGLERVTQNILGLENIRQASLFPRDMERMDIRLSS